MISKNHEMDEIDREIIEILQKDPNVSHTKIARKVHRSQPTIGHRIKKLENTGVLQYHVGLNLKSINLYYAKVAIQTKNPDLVIQIVKDCPHIIHALELSGRNNFEIIITSKHLKDLDKIVNFHFRNNPEVKKVKMEIILDIFNDFILPISLTTNICKCTL
ncbi:MAG: Lrp/AsnC family transcriptional regulator [Promethearchaeota archaeon]